MNSNNIINDSQLLNWDYSIYKDEIFQLPIIKSPFDTYYNKYIDNISNDIAQWHIKCQFLGPDKLDQYLLTKPYLFSSYYYCHLNEKVLPFIIKFVDMIFIYDDLYLESSNCTIESLNQFFIREKQYQSIFGVEWWSIVDGLNQYGNKQSVEMFLKEFEVFMKNAYHIHLKENHNFNDITLDQYSKIRHLDFGFDLIVSASIIDCEGPSDEIRCNSLFKKLNRLSSLVCVLINDIYSFVKERDMHDSMNYIKIMTLKKKSIQKAINHTEKIILKTNISILSIENQLLLLYKNDKNLNQYILRLNSIISATFYIHQNHKRYTTHNKNYIKTIK